MLTLYYAPRTCALASHIALEQAGADYDVVRLDFRANAQRDRPRLSGDQSLGTGARPGHDPEG